MPDAGLSQRACQTKSSDSVVHVRRALYVTVNLLVGAAFLDQEARSKGKQRMKVLLCMYIWMHGVRPPAIIAKRSRR